MLAAKALISTLTTALSCAEYNTLRTVFIFFMVGHRPLPTPFTAAELPCVAVIVTLIAQRMLRLALPQAVP